MAVETSGARCDNSFLLRYRGRRTQCDHRVNSISISISISISMSISISIHPRPDTHTPICIYRDEMCLYL